MSDAGPATGVWAKAGPERFGAGLPDASLALLDIRDRVAFVAGHIAASTHIPFSDLVLRRHELPAPGTPLQVLADEPAILQAAVLQLSAWQYPITASYLLEEALLARAKTDSRWQSGAGSRQLWQPSQTLAIALQLPSVQLARQAVGNTALDLACGSGREALFLAQHGYLVTAVDCKVDALERLTASADAADRSIQAICQDLELAPPDWPAHCFALIHVARYLHRPLFPLLMNWLRPGGVLVYETFLRGAEQFGGPRRPQFLLEHGELTERFAKWSILHDRVQTLSDGRPVQQFVVSKPSVEA